MTFTELRRKFSANRELHGDQRLAENLLSPDLRRDVSRFMNLVEGTGILGRALAF